MSEKAGVAISVYLINRPRRLTTVSILLMLVYRVIARAGVSAVAKVFREMLSKMQVHFLLTGGIVTSVTHFLACTSFDLLVCRTRNIPG